MFIQDSSLVLRGTQASRPTASSAYLNKFYFATDTRKRYLCQDYGSGPVWTLEWYDRRYPTDSNDRIVLLCNETSGTTLANSGPESSSNFTITGTPTLAEPCAFGVGVGFTGTSGEYASGPTAFEPTTNITVSLVARVKQVKFTRFICKAYNAGHGAPYTSLFFYTNSAGNFSAGINVGATERIPSITGGLLALNKPYHLCLKYDGTTIKVLIDGRVAGSSAQSGVIDWGAHEPWQLSRFNASEEANAVIQDVRIANVARSDAYIDEMAKRAIGVWTEVDAA